MRVLVTGGAGFIGSHIVDLLVAAGHGVRVLDCLHPLAHRGRPGYLNPGAEYLLEDVRDEGAVARAVQGIDAVTHQAAVVGLGVDFADIAEYVSVNDLGTASVLKALHQTGFAGRFVLAGSMVVYGEGRYRCPEHGVVEPDRRSTRDLQAGLFDPGCPVCGVFLSPVAVPEEAGLRPRSLYAATKLHQEHLCESFQASTDAAVISLRYHNVYGPRMPFDTPYAGVASIFRTSLEQGRAPQVFEDGAQIRDFVHVHDVARANLIALQARPEISGPFNVCSGVPRPLLEMALALRRGYPDGSPDPEITGRFRSSDVRHVFADPTRATRDLGFEAEVSFEEGMRRFVTDVLRIGSGA